VSVAFIFPGQGSQTAGMLKRLPEHSAVKETLRQAGDTLSVDVTELDTEAALQSTVNVQLALFIAGVAAAKVLQTSKVVPMAVAGMSVGAFAAAVTCNTLSFSDGLKLVKKRAELMENSFPKGYGMSAIVGLTERQVLELVKDCYSNTAPVFVSNINAPRKIIVSGACTGLEKVEQSATKSGARKVERLNVTVPSHCPIFETVAEELTTIVKTFQLQEPTIPYISNVKARPLKNALQIGEDLARNVAHGVRWYDSISVLTELGCNLFIEVNPGNTLCRLSAELFEAQKFISLEETSVDYIQHYNSGMSL
jgi:malonate decarboxylase epsilon subunit